MPHRTVLVVLIWMSVLACYCLGKEEKNEFPTCYINDTIPQRCEPPPETFSLNVVPTVNSTCGNPPVDFCTRKYSLTTGEVSIDECYTCDSSDPENSHGPELMTDFFSKGTETWWQSESGILRPEAVSIQIDLGTEVQVESILFQFISLKPDAFYILRSDDNGNTFEPFNYFARNCLEQYGINPEVHLDPHNETQALCQRISNPRPGQVTFVPSINRPSGNDSIPGYSSALYDFSTVTNIRVILDGHHMFDSLNQSDYYYAIEDFSVVGRCQCNGHASECIRQGNERTCVCQHNTNGSRCERCKDFYNDLGWNIANGGEPFECKRCECYNHTDVCIFNQTLFEMSNHMSGGMCVNCTDNTEGPHCDQCVEFFYPNKDLPVYSPEYCQACDCNPAGIMNDGQCERHKNSSLGQCSCKPNVGGRVCDQCLPGYFNLTDGCKKCNCSASLSDGVCDNITGECICKPNVKGDKCDTCEPGYYLSDPITCSPCNCDVGGSLSTICDINTGKCLCRTGVTGMTCTEVDGKRFFPFIDHYIYEAEESNGLFEFSYRSQNSDVDKGYTGSGYVSIKDESDIINFGEFTPPVGGVYEFVLRYRLSQMHMWDSVELRLTFNASEYGQGPPTGCSEYAGSILLYQGLPMGAAQGAPLEVCLRGGRTYKVVLNGFVSGSSDEIELEIDSLVVIPKQPDDLDSLKGFNNYQECVENFRSLATRGSSLTQCRDISFSVFTEMFNGTLACDCDKDGSISDSCEEYGGQCNCSQYNIGRKCDVCAAGGHYELCDCNRCVACGCSSDGSVDEFCDRFGGGCSCLSNVTGKLCDRCLEGYFNLTAGVGCEPCHCNEQGSKNLQCNDSGVCDCKDGVGGEKCDYCLPERFNYPTCSECNCSAAGSIGLSCNTSNGKCDCHKNTEGMTCDTCSQGTFNLHTSNPEGCQPCFCSGVTTSCASAPGYVAEQISTSFSITNSWTIRPASNGYAKITADSNGARVDTNTTAYLVAPGNYLGNKLSSYIQYLNIIVDIGDTAGSSSEGYDVAIESKDDRLLGRFVEEPEVGNQTLQVRFYEHSGWKDSSTNLPVSASQLQSTLLDLTSLQIRVSLGSDVVISSVSLDSTAPGSGSEVGWVEQCNCNYDNYTGLSCEQCADGYTRSESGLCILCDCNGHSSKCDMITGVCIDCKNNTTGDHCEVCQSGYYGDPIQNIPCRRCMCPFAGSKGQYSQTCELREEDIVCTDCQEGHIGEQCETCEVGYFGDPEGHHGNSTKCTNCSCSNNINLTDPDSCDNITGICLKCLYNTSGNECEKCKEGYYGDPITAKNCTACECDPDGSKQMQCDNKGICDCLSNVTGSKCNECAPMHYGIFPGEGCRPCDCDPVGSISLACNDLTGQCSCKNHVTGRQCNECEPGYYNLTVNGCSACECGEGSSSPQCSDDGSCDCPSYIFIGKKCDRCIENYFINNGTCEECPSCYGELQADANHTRELYSKLLKEINTLAEQNDPHQSFEDRRNFALDAVMIFDNVRGLLNSAYGKIPEAIENLTELIDCLKDEPEAREAEIADAQVSVSPYEALARSSDGIVINLKQELYEGQAVLLQIENYILPSIENSASFIENVTFLSNSTLKQVEEYFEDLKNQTNKILALASLATEAANSSLFTANSLLALSTSNNYTVHSVQSTVKELEANISTGLQELEAFNMTVLHNHVSVLNIKNNLPVVPSEASLRAQLQNATELENQLKDLLINYSKERELFQSLNNSLASLKNEYSIITRMLTQTMSQINWYMYQLQSTYDKASDASSSAQVSIADATAILGDLKNFSNAISALKIKANEALNMADEINRTVLMVEEIVSESLAQLEGIRDELDLVQPESIVAHDNSTYLKEASSKLLNNSEALVEETEQLINAHITNQDNVNQLYSETASAIEEIDIVESTANKTFGIVYSTEVQNLPEKTAGLSANASSTVSKLYAALLTSPSVDIVFLEEVENFVKGLENDISSENITDLYEKLLVLYNEQEDELWKLNSGIVNIEKRVTRLKQIMASLPSSCDSDF